MREEGRRGNGACYLGAQVLMVAASNVRPSALRLREGTIIFSRARSLQGSVNDTTPGGSNYTLGWLFGWVCRNVIGGMHRQIR